MAPLPKKCGHIHRWKTFGGNAKGGHNSAPLAAYPQPMCAYIAMNILDDFMKIFPASCGWGISSSTKRGVTFVNLEGEDDQPSPSSRTVDIAGNSLNSDAVSVKEMTKKVG